MPTIHETLAQLLNAISLGNEVIQYVVDHGSAASDVEDLASKIERYSDNVDLFIHRADIVECGEDALEQFKQVHTRVIEIAEERLAKRGEDQRALMKRAQGIRRYVDTLPSRVSLRKPRKT